MANTTEKTGDVAIVPANQSRRSSSRVSSILDDNGKKKKSSVKSILNFIYNPRKKTVLGRDSLNWGKKILTNKRPHMNKKFF